MINEEVEKLQSLFDEKSTQYQNGTNYGKNIEEQSKYNLIFKRLRS